METLNPAFSNKTANGIENINLRYTWAAYWLFVIISSLIGDTTILVASIKYKAFKLHRIIVTIIQHIAVCDLMVTISDVLPRFVSVLSSDWLLGKFICYFTSYARYTFNIASLLLICIMTSSKLLLVKYPLRFGMTESTKAHLFCLACCTTALFPGLAFLVVDKNDVFFSYRDYQCDYGFTSPIWTWLFPLLTVFLGIMPTFLVVVCTISLLLIARKVAGSGKERMKWQGIITTVLTAAVYCSSLLPYIVYRIGESVLHVSDKSTSFFYKDYFRIVTTFISLNTISNFYIYSLTVDSFRSFVCSGFKKSFSSGSNMETSTSQGRVYEEEKRKTQTIHELKQRTPV